MIRRTLTLTALPAVFLVALPASAQDEEPVAPEVETVDVSVQADEVVNDVEMKSGRVDGLESRLSLGATFALSDNRNVIGQTDGSTVTFGFKFDTAIDYNHAEHEWRTTLGIQEGLTKTPIIDQVVKSTDDVSFETIYLYHVMDWWGFFIPRFGLDTQAFRGHDTQVETVQYDITRPDGTVDSITASRIQLTDPFQPLKLKESAGPFIQPLSRDDLSIEIRAGLGGRHFFADNQLAVDDDEATDGIIEVTELQTTHQMGAEASIDFWGELYENRMSYRAGAEVMLPFVYTELEGDDRDSLELMNVELGGALSFKLVEWASLDYEIKAVREPLLVDEFQVQNNLLLTIGIAAQSKPVGAEPPPEEEPPADGGT